MKPPERVAARKAIDDETLELWDWNVEIGKSSATEGALVRLGVPNLCAGESSFVAAVHEDDRERVRRAMDTALDPRGRGVLAVEFRAAASPERKLAARGRTFFEGEGQARRAVRMVVALEDANAGRLANENAGLREALRHAAETTQAWLSILSHDLRNPLGVISMGLNLVENDLPSNAPSHRFVASTRRSVRRIDALIAALLDAGRLLTGPIEIETAMVEIAPVLTEAIDALRQVATEKGVSLSIAVAMPTRLRMAIDRNRIAQVIASLVSSAIESCERGASIEVRADVILGALEVTISASGYGMQETDASHALDPLRSPRTAAGLALQVARGIVEAHDGHIVFERTPGRGTRIRFTLPLREPEKKVEARPAHSNP